MSKSHRTEFQKARRAYLDKCKKDGKKPMGVEAFYKAWHKKMQNKANAVSEQPKPKTQKKTSLKHGSSVESKPSTVHEIRKGDTVEFVGFTSSRFASFAIKALILAYGQLIEAAHSADRKCDRCEKHKKTVKKPVER